MLSANAAARRTVRQPAAGEGGDLHSHRHAHELVNVGAMKHALTVLLIYAAFRREPVTCAPRLPTLTSRRPAPTATARPPEVAKARIYW
jgi:hypothetical protein